MANLTVNIRFVGLCSFLNMYDKEAYMPPPSVVLHKTPDHMAMLAWNEQDTHLVFPVFNPPPPPSPQFGFSSVNLAGEELTLNNDMSSTPNVDSSSFGKHIATILKYGNLKSVPVFDQKHVPLPGQKPDLAAESAFMRFGDGDISSDWETQYPYIFQDKAGNASTNSRKYHRRVTYTFDIADVALIVTADKFDQTSSRAFTFKPTVSGQPVTIWIANAMDLDEDVDPQPPVFNPAGDHFKYFYRDLADKSATIYKPVLDGVLPPAPPMPMSMPMSGAPARGAGTGYCGPDNQP